MYRLGNEGTREYIRFKDGDWFAAVEGGPEVQWWLFFFHQPHDIWVTETLPGGRVDVEPTVGTDDMLRMKGAFSTTYGWPRGCPPVEYSYCITPIPEGLSVRCELEKTAALTLIGGVQLRLTGAAEKLRRTERVWFAPSSHGTTALVPAATGNRMLVELLGNRSLSLRLTELRPMKNSGSRDDPILDIQLLDDFRCGEKAVVEYTISFADMPERFPGTIDPSREELKIHAVTPSALQVPRYERLELRVDLDATYDNPFDRDDVRLDAVFTSPSGKSLDVPGFFTMDCHRQVIEGTEVIEPQETGGWRVRFTPCEVGRYEWKLKLGDRYGKETGGEGSFACVPGQRPGFVRRSAVDPHYLAFDNGQGFFPIGHNVPVYDTTGQRGDEAMRKLASARENVNRWSMGSESLGIEWLDRVGWYRQDVAARVDHLLDLAADHDLYYIMCLDTSQDFAGNGWKRNPYSAKNGGPCCTVNDWFADEAARRYYRNRLQYMIARWGYSPNILCWELGNEMDGWGGNAKEVCEDDRLDWHRKMASYLKKHDRFKHLITTSFVDWRGKAEYWMLKDIDIVQTHNYTNDNANVAESVCSQHLEQRSKFNKPLLFGEFGITYRENPANLDPNGWGIHNAIWAGMMSSSAGGPLPYWHIGYIHPCNLYPRFTSLARFTRDLPLGSAIWEPIRTTTEFVHPGRAPDFRDITVVTINNFEQAEHNLFLFRRDGSIDKGYEPQRYLHALSVRKNPPEFVVEYPEPGELIVRVGSVLGNGVLKIWIDDTLKDVRAFPSSERKCRASKRPEETQLDETTFNKDVVVEVPKGRHRICVESDGDDWLTVDRYMFTGCREVTEPHVLVCGMKTDGQAVVWLQNKDSSWYNHARDAVRPVNDFRVLLHELTAGRYSIDWWDTWKGEVYRTDEIEITSEPFPLTIDELTTDTALAIRAK